MNTKTLKKAVLGLIATALLLAAGVAAGLWWAGKQPPAMMEASTEGAQDGRTVLYWYDPMVPQQKFDKPGKSPFMDMDLVPKYADEGGDASTVKIDQGVAQNLGVRLATVKRGVIDTDVRATGIVDFNEREVAIVQARSGGFVERVARLAPSDVVAAGAFIAELLVPEWAALQQEYLALKAVGDMPLEEAARERMRLGGMPDSLIREVDASGKVRNRIMINAPRGGVIQTLEVRPGMTLMAGQTLALASEKVDLAMAAWRGGKGELVDLVMARREFIDADLKAIALEGARQQMAAQLHFAYSDPTVSGESQ